MRLPQTPERIKEAPAQALRAVFAGVGQVLLMTERIRRRAIGQEHSHAVSAGAPDTRDAPAQAQGNGGHTATLEADQTDQVKTETTGTSATSTNSTATSSAAASTAKASTASASSTKASTAKTSTAKASTAKTGTAKTGTAKTELAKSEASTTKAGTAKADTAPTETATPAQPGTATPAEAATPGVLPVPHYSELSIASLRARLRGLDIAQVRDLLSYERAHEDRANVITMFERRIAKLEEAEGADPAAG